MSLPENFSILAMPIYWLLSVAPHGYGIYIGSGGNPLKWDNKNPRSSNLKANLKSRLSPERYALFERTESASANAFENMPFFYGAIVIGKLSGIETSVLDRFAATFLAARVAHTFTYLLGSNQTVSYARTGVFFYSIWQCVKIYLGAAKVAGF